MSLLTRIQKYVRERRKMSQYDDVVHALHTGDELRECALRFSDVAEIAALQPVAWYALWDETAKKFLTDEFKDGWAALKVGAEKPDDGGEWFPLYSIPKEPRKLN